MEPKSKKPEKAAAPEVKPPVPPAPTPEPDSLFEEEEFATTLMYRCPGAHQRPGGTFDFTGVTSEKDREARLADGWHDTMPEAIKNAGPEPPPPLRVPSKITR